MAKRTLVFETWIGNDGQHYCHLRSGREILLPAEGYTRVRSVKRLYEILTSLSKTNCRYVELSVPYGMKANPPHFEGKLNRSWP